MKLDDSLTLLRALQQPHLYPHPVTRFDLRETHISWVLLTGPFAYKIKKPVNFGFVDFSSLAQRQFFCHEEIRLNQRSAPDIYVEVLPISGTPEHPRLNGQGKPFEFAVKMRQFMADATLDHVLAQVRPDQIDRLAGDIATFHHNAAGAERETSFGSPELIAQVIAEVFERIPSDGRFSEHYRSLEQLRHWLTRFHAAHAGDFEKRKVSGFIRECHGDLHLANLALLDDRIIAFDGIEFSERLRWIDVINDAAFTVMDFQTRGQPAVARRFLNRYLEFTGDYEGLGLLPFYEVYRALVRVKVAALAFAHVRGQRISSHADDFIRYLSAAQSLTEAQAPWLVIMHGVTGTGKSSVSETLLEQTGAIRLRSDVERKRLFGLSLSDRSSGKIKGAVYGAETTRKTYDHLQALARQLLLFGYPVIVDATFLKRQHRDSFKRLAASLNVPFLILAMQAKPATLRERIAARAVASDDVSEADLSVLKQQERDQEPLAPDERVSTLRLHSGDPFDPAEVVGMLESTREEGRSHAPGWIWRQATPE